MASIKPGIGKAEGEKQKKKIALFVKEARKRKLPVFTIRSEAYQVGIGKNLRFILPIGSYRGTVSAKNKYYTSEIAESCGVPVPKHALMKKKERKSYRKIIKGLKFPLVVKPFEGTQTVGITLGIKNHKQLKKAFSLAFATCDEVIIEEFIPNILDYRVTFFKSEYLGTTLTVPEKVRGDGKSTVIELVKKHNKEVRKKEYGLPPLTHDWVVKTYVAQYGYTLASVPPSGKVMRIYGRGGTYKDYTNDIHPENIELCRNICEVLGVEFGGVDFMSPDASVPYYKNGAVINEVNSYPGLKIYNKVLFGKKRDLPKKILRMMFPSERSAWIPIKHKGRPITDFAQLKKLMKVKPKRVVLEEPDRVIKNARLPLLNYLVNDKVKSIII